MRRENQITDFAYRPVAAAGVSRIVASRFDCTDRVGDRYRKAHMLQQRQIGNIVADESALCCGDGELRRQFVEGSNFVLAALDDMCDAKFGHSSFNGAGLTTADDCYGYSRIKQAPDAETVLSIECF